MYRYLVLLLLVGFCHLSKAQKRVIVYDLETRTPLKSARLWVDRARTYSTDYTGHATLPAKFDSVAVSHAKYLTRKLSSQNLTDSIGLIPVGHTLDEVTVYGEDLSKRLNQNLDLWTKQNLKEIQLATAHSGIGDLDMLSVFDFAGKARRKRTRKVNESLKKLDQYSEDPIEQAYYETLKGKKAADDAAKE